MLSYHLVTLWAHLHYCLMLKMFYSSLKEPTTKENGLTVIHDNMFFLFTFFFPKTFLKKETIKFACDVTDKQRNWIWIWYSDCLHNSPRQNTLRNTQTKVCSDMQSEGTKGSVKLLFIIYLSVADNKFKVTGSMGTQIAAWIRQFICGGKFRVYALTWGPRSVML